jgi:hypothetical protein
VLSGEPVELEAVLFEALPYVTRIRLALVANNQPAHVKYCTE